MMQVSKEPLCQLSAFVESLPPSIIEELLATSSMREDEITAFREQYQNMLATLSQVQQAYQHYEEIVRPPVKAALEEYLRLLKSGPEASDELICQLALLLDHAAKINFLDVELQDLLKEIWPEVQWPETLPAFAESEVPDDSRWPRCRLKDIFEENNRKAQEFWNNSWLLVKLDIEAATEELKKEKVQVTAIAKVIGHCSQIAGFLCKIFL
ncbi:MAG: hypothetical protein FDX02_02950 [Chlorobium sp.]|nr:MAG: hypothetical protein FDX02_02950 [Chlorobium sp.]